MSNYLDEDLTPLSLKELGLEQKNEDGPLRYEKFDHQIEINFGLNPNFSVSAVAITLSWVQTKPELVYRLLRSIMEMDDPDNKIKIQTLRLAWTLQLNPKYEKIVQYLHTKDYTQFYERFIQMSKIKIDKVMLN